MSTVQPTAAAAATHRDHCTYAVERAVSQQIGTHIQVAHHGDKRTDAQCAAGSVTSPHCTGAASCAAYAVYRRTSSRRCRTSTAAAPSARSAGSSSPGAGVRRAAVRTAAGTWYEARDMRSLLQRGDVGGLQATHCKLLAAQEQNVVKAGVCVMLHTRNNHDRIWAHFDCHKRW